MWGNKKTFIALQKLDRIAHTAILSLSDLSFLIMLSKLILFTRIGICAIFTSQMMYLLWMCVCVWLFMVEWYMVVVCGWVCTVCVRALQKTQCPSLYQCAASPLWRNGQNLAQRHENVVKMYQSHEAHMRLSPHLYIAVLTLYATPDSRGIYFRADIWWKHFSRSREFDLKLSLAPWGSVPVCMMWICVCV